MASAGPSSPRVSRALVAPEDGGRGPLGGPERGFSGTLSRAHGRPLAGHRGTCPRAHAHAPWGCFTNTPAGAGCAASLVLSAAGGAGLAPGLRPGEVPSPEAGRAHAPARGPVPPAPPPSASLGSLRWRRDGKAGWPTPPHVGLAVLWRHRAGPARGRNRRPGARVGRGRGLGLCRLAAGAPVRGPHQHRDLSRWARSAGPWRERTGRVLAPDGCSRGPGAAIAGGSRSVASAGTERERS